MEFSPSKRRRLSDATINPAAIFPPDDHIINHEGHSTVSSRPSFLSPTKASLARFYPTLLSEVTPTTKGAQTQSVAGNGASGPSSVRRLNPTALRPTTPTRNRKSIRPRQWRAITVSPTRSTQPLPTSLSAVPRGRSQTPGLSLPSEDRLQEPSEDFITSSLKAFRVAENRAREPVRQELVRELPAHLGGQRDIDISNEVFAQPPKVSNDIEPELPLTPNQLGLEPAPDPPKGLLSSSPCRKVSKKRTEGTKSSPLKPQAASSCTSPSLNNNPSRIKSPIVQSHYQDAKAMLESSTEVALKQKRKTLDQLAIQLKELQNDVLCLEQEAVQNHDRAAAGFDSQEEADLLISIITSENPTHIQIPPPPKPPPLSSRLALFLPFARKPGKLPIHLGVSKASSFFDHKVPIENRLRHIQTFTPFTVSSTERLVSSSITTTNFLNHQTLVLSSPQQILSLVLDLTTDTVTSAVDSLILTSLTPWADRELGAWVREHIAPTGDISSVGWAAGRYWERALTRAQFWHTCHDKYAHLLRFSGVVNGEDDQGYAPKAPNHTNTPFDPPHLLPSNPNGSNSTMGGISPSHIRPELLRHLGRHDILFQPHPSSSLSPCLLIEWRIGFDWTGETENHLRATAIFPSAWKDVDERRSLDTVGTVFDGLLGRMGVDSAVESIVDIIFGSRDEPSGEEKRQSK